MLIDNIKLALAQPAVPSGTGNLSKDETDEIVGAQSHGNIWLQLAEFYMQEEVDADYERFKDYKFANQ
ncbi:hypothetical protein [Sulfitobacter sp. AS59]|uniref:hypothetical protein n=1 Tax=Sulfitobacter sp. AS59 TaxID=3135784 RepID=UPI003179E4F5